MWLVQCSAPGVRRRRTRTVVRGRRRLSTQLIGASAARPRAGIGHGSRCMARTERTGLASLPEPDRQAIFHFALLWSLFTAKALNHLACAPGDDCACASIVANASNAPRLDYERPITFDEDLVRISLEAIRVRLAPFGTHTIESRARSHPTMRARMRAAATATLGEARAGRVRSGRQESAARMSSKDRALARR
ncbi:MAG: hypothetical protein JWO36_622 [Myxococcales bacterium]|nr:hypothetical protein [Myxococcales bacterium]